MKKNNLKKNNKLIFFSKSYSLALLFYMRKNILFDFDQLKKQDKLINLKKK